MRPRPPTSTLFPYTTLFRSENSRLSTASLSLGEKLASPGLELLCGRKLLIGIRARHNGRHSSRRSEEHTSELQSQSNLVCRLLLEKKKRKTSPRPCASRLHR